MKTKSEEVKIFLLPGGVVPSLGSEDATALDVTARGVVSLQFEKNQYERQLIFDFKHPPTRPIKDSTPHAGLSYVLEFGKTHSLRLLPHAMVYFGAGFVLEMPRGIYAVIGSRGSTIKKGLRVSNSDSFVDQGFRGEPVIAVENWTNYFVEIWPEDLTLGQISFYHHSAPGLIIVSSIEELSKTSRGSGNHGSTDKKK